MPRRETATSFALPLKNAVSGGPARVASFREEVSKNLRESRRRRSVGREHSGLQTTERFTMRAYLRRCFSWRLLPWGHRSSSASAPARGEELLRHPPAPLQGAGAPAEVVMPDSPADRPTTRSRASGRGANVVTGIIPSTGTIWSRHRHQATWYHFLLTHYQVPSAGPGTIAVTGILPSIGDFEVNRCSREINLWMHKFGSSAGGRVRGHAMRAASHCVQIGGVTARARTTVFPNEATASSPTAAMSRQTNTQQSQIKALSSPASSGRACINTSSVPRWSSSSCSSGTRSGWRMRPRR